MKVIIPVAGIGTRLRPHTHTQPKALVPVAGKPILSHIVDNLIEAGLDDFILVIGYLGDKIESYVKSKYPAIKVRFVIQEPREGIGHAIWLCKDFVGNDEILIALGDTIFDIDLKSVIEQPYSSLGIKKVDDPRHFGAVELDSEGFILKVVEKPKIPKSNLALVGLYKIKESKMLMDALDYNIKNNIHTQNEFHLTDGIMKMIEAKIKIKTFPVENWYDCGGKDNLLETNAILLKRLAPPYKSKYNAENTIIIPPVSIADNCKIANSIIGPNVSIGENTIISYSILKDSIIGSFSQLDNAVLHHSLVGSDACLKGLSQSLNIGDSTEIDFS
jgi:glucose-1-phosphate thymidylyltransferase